GAGEQRQLALVRTDEAAGWVLDVHPSERGGVALSQARQHRGWSMLESCRCWLLVVSRQLPATSYQIPVSVDGGEEELPHPGDDEMVQHQVEIFDVPVVMRADDQRDVDHVLHHAAVEAEQRRG